MNSAPTRSAARVQPMLTRQFRFSFGWGMSMNSNWIADIEPLLDVSGSIDRIDEVIDCDGRKLAICARIDGDRLRLRPNLAEETNE